MKTKDILIVIGLVIGLLILIAFLLSIQRSHKLYDLNSLLKGQYETLKNEKEKSDKASKEIIVEQDKVIKKLDEVIKLSDDIVNEKAKEIKNKDSKISNLEKIYPALKDKDKQIENLQEQLKAWAEKFSLAELTIKEKDKIMFSLTGKFDAQKKISSEYLLQIGREINLRNVAEERIQTLEKNLKQAKIYSKVKDWIVAGFIGYTIYSLIKK